MTTRDDKVGHEDEGKSTRNHRADSAVPLGQPMPNGRVALWNTRWHLSPRLDTRATTGTHSGHGARLRYVADRYQQRREIQRDHVPEFRCNPERSYSRLIAAHSQT